MIEGKQLVLDVDGRFWGACYSWDTRCKYWFSSSFPSTLGTFPCQLLFTPHFHGPADFFPLSTALSFHSPSINHAFTPFQSINLWRGTYARVACALQCPPSDDSPGVSVPPGKSRFILEELQPWDLWTSHRPPPLRVLPYSDILVSRIDPWKEFHMPTHRCWHRRTMQII